VKEKTMCESFLKFVPVDDVSGQSLANHIITELKGLNIEIKNLRGQGYDGAASMSGKTELIFQQKIPKNILELLCFYHFLICLYNN